MVTMCAFLTAIAGVSLSLLKAVNARLGERVGIMESAFISHLMGAVVAATLLIIGIRTGHFSFSGIPFYFFMGGCLGLFMIAMINYAIPVIGAMAALICMILSQLLTSLVVDHCGLFNACVIKVDSGRIIGVILVFIGAGLVLWKR